MYRTWLIAPCLLFTGLAMAQPLTDRIIVHPAPGAQMRSLQHNSNGSTILHLEQPLEGEALQEVLEDLMARPEVAWAEPDLLMRPLVQPADDPYYAQGSQWGLSAIHIEEAWAQADGTGVTVAVLDTGVLPHEDLASRLLPGYDLISDPWMGNDGDGRDADAIDSGDWVTADEAATYGCFASDSSWHGTHVAGIVAAADDTRGVIGVAPKADILPVRVLGKCGGYTSDIADGLRWAAGLPVPGLPLNPHPAQVANLSLGGDSLTCPRTYQKAIDDVRAAGMVVVVAAGNEGQDAVRTTPANCQGVMTVAATGPEGQLAGYSNFGATIDVAAPGGDQRFGHSAGIVSSLDGSAQAPAFDNSHAFYQGTSMAAPHVAGVVALILERDPSLTPAQIEQRLVQTAQGGCSNCGAGLIDAQAALQDISGSEEPPVQDDNGLPWLASGQIAFGQVAQGELAHVRIDVPPSQTVLVQLAPVLNDVDLLVRFDQPSQYSDGAFDCISQEYGNAIEQCILYNDGASARTLYLSAYGYEAGGYALGAWLY